ncbi:aldose 1-epimerase family protein [Pontiellaceae bacterium B12227]|nr:aldose 1-epimerase family protein [Pontiellaceae bacterium B12227]
MITIRNDKFSASIALRGAELRSFSDLQTGEEFMWQADPDVWAGSAPILFPMVGKLVEGKTTINGKPYVMPGHGVLRNLDAQLVKQEAERAELQFTSTEETLAHYPFPFKFTVCFSLEADTLTVCYRAENTGTETLPFMVGSHPAFALDLENFAHADYFIEFGEPETLDLLGMRDLLISTFSHNYLDHATEIPLSETLFDQDALIFDEIQSDTVRLKNRQRTRYLEMNTGGAKQFGIWAKPGAAYVCLEPWHGVVDFQDSNIAFEKKPGMMTLPVGECFETFYSVRVVD